MNMTEDEIYAFVTELQVNGAELYSFVAEHCDENLTANEIDDLVSELETDFLSLREFVIVVLAI